MEEEKEEEEEKDEEEEEETITTMMIMAMNIYFQGQFKWEFDFLGERVSGFLRI
jgi:hypothetical protein